MSSSSAYDHAAVAVDITAVISINVPPKPDLKNREQSPHLSANEMTPAKPARGCGLFSCMCPQPIAIMS